MLFPLHLRGRNCTCTAMKLSEIGGPRLSISYLPVGKVVSDSVNDLGCGQNVRLQQLLKLLPADRTRATATAAPVSPRLFRCAADLLQQADVPPDTVVLAMPSQLLA